ncbi:lactate utilization protein [Accumulibacter sp.]|uniref:LutC/YkgG family protein n=1 Tax=Accumulibacter sp. TaxID=2053492 RepID=UPI0026092B82|nr:lactate utilization protein [Accumulibacter sp.]
MSARDNILQRLRAAPSGTPPLSPDVRAWQALSRGGMASAARAARVDLFCEKMAFWQAEVVRVTRDDWPAQLRTLCAAKGVRSLLYGEDTEQAAALLAAGIGGLQPYDRAIDDWKQDLFENIDASFTSTRGGIAETGTLIIWPDASEPRLMSLVPPIHFALLDAAKLYDTLLDAMIEQGWSGGLPTNALLVSGPSKTADIQVTLAYGAHGPRELIVLLLVDEEQTA